MRSVATKFMVNMDLSRSSCGWTCVQFDTRSILRRNEVKGIYREGIPNMILNREALLVCLLLLCSRDAYSTDPIKPTEDAPSYRLSNFRTETDDNGDVVMAIDFMRTRKGKGTVFVSGKSGNGSLSIAAPISSWTDSGTIRLKSMFGKLQQQQLNIELYLVQFNNWGGDMIRYAMVSNPVRIGNPGEPTKPRSWTAEEKAAYENYLRIKNDDTAMKPRKSYPVSIAVPDHSQLIPASATVLPGTRLQACYANKWNPITALSENEDGSLNVRWDDYGPDFDCSMIRTQLIIRKDDLNGTQAPSSDSASGESSPSEGASAKGSGRFAATAKPRKSYPVSIEVPSHSEIIPKELQVKAGTRLEACYAGKWNPITALSENVDGTLNVRWDDYGPAFDCSMIREELIITKQVLRMLQSSRTISPAQTRAARTWVDATGQFKVVATLVRKSPTNVILLTEAGKEVTVPISRLSEADREFLASINSQLGPK